MKNLAFLGTGNEEGSSSDALIFQALAAGLIAALFITNHLLKDKFTAPWQRVLRIILLTLGLVAAGLFMLIILWLDGSF